MTEQEKRLRELAEKNWPPSLSVPVCFGDLRWVLKELSEARARAEVLLVQISEEASRDD